MLGLGFCSSIITLESAGAKLYRRNLRGTLNTPNVAYVLSSFQVPANKNTDPTCQFSTVHIEHYTLVPHASCWPKNSNRNEITRKTGNALTPADGTFSLYCAWALRLWLWKVSWMCTAGTSWHCNALCYTKKSSSISYASFFLIIF